jgi:hypothetical protein
MKSSFTYGMEIFNELSVLIYTYSNIMLLSTEDSRMRGIIGWISISISAINLIVNILAVVIYQMMILWKKFIN